MIEISGFKCRLIRTSRKNMRLSVNGNGGICVSVPKRASMKQITEFISQHSEFIKNAVSKQRARNNIGIFGNNPEAPFLYYKGEKLPVIFTKTTCASFDGSIFTIPEGLTADEQRETVTELYRPLAKAYISERVKELSARVGLSYSKLRFAQSTSRWGSRSSTGTLSFSVYLIAVSPGCIDHVIYHELAHVKEMNHGEKFYDLLSSMEPDHRQRQRELHDNYGKWLISFKSTS